MRSDRASLVAVIEGEPVGRHELLTLVRSQGYDARGYANAASLLGATRSAALCCVIADLAAADADAIGVIDALRRAMSAVPVVAVAGRSSVRQAVAVMKAGASDFIEKPCAAETIRAAIEDALERDDGADRTIDEASAKFASLTKREREVLSRLLSGKINKTIGRELGISPRTVEVYRAHIMTKARVDSLAELVRIARAAGMG